ncbi:MAG TPA: DNA polymerase III subunit gamma/tau, partial [Chthoniobacterales bacterium]
MSYRVFARKYRPQTFDEVVGQEHITRTLQNAISQSRLAQAYLFVGPRGIGKTSTARILAKALNCQQGPTVTPCGVCDACREIAEGNSLDVLEIDGASNNSVEHVRELRENAAYQPARGPYKIYLVDEVHMLSTAAFNALLKTLEEPPPHVKFIFATTEAQKVPATITSRCQRFDLRRIPAELIARHLQHIATNENVVLDDEAAATIAKGADGGLRDAESMLDQLVAFCGERITAEDVLSVFGFTGRETVEALCGAIFAQDASGALGIVAAQAAAGKDLSRLMADLIAYLRDQLVRSVQAGKQAEAAISRDRLLALLDHFAEAESRLRWATDKRLYFDVAVIKAVHLLGEASLGDVIDTLMAIGGGEPLPERPAARPIPAQAPAPARMATSAPAASARAESAPVSVTKSDALESTPSDPKPPQAAAELAPAPKVEVVAIEPAELDLLSQAAAALKETRVEEVPITVLPVPPAPVAAPEIPAADTPSASGDIWPEVAAMLKAESPIRFAWLELGVSAGAADGRMRVRFPLSEQEQTESFFWDDVRKRTEAVLSERLGGKVELVCEFTA